MLEALQLHLCLLQALLQVGNLGRAKIMASLTQDCGSVDPAPGREESPALERLDRSCDDVKHSKEQGEQNSSTEKIPVLLENRFQVLDFSVTGDFCRLELLRKFFVVGEQQVDSSVYFSFQDFPIIPVDSELSRILADN